MQTTLLTIAVAVILALVAALVGPFFIDWGSYRSLFEQEASRLTGLDVHVRGQIDARLLPSPRLQLHNIEIGRGGETLKARALAIEFALSPLLRGEWRAQDMRVVGPQIQLGIDKAGEVKAPALALDIAPDALSIERLGIEDGTVRLTDAASGAAFKLEKLWFNGELRSLLGPVKGEGAVTVGGALYPFRLSTGRATGDGALHVHLNVDPVEIALNVEADGTLTTAQGKPQFQGTWSVARPVGIARNSAAVVTQPWRFGGKIKLTPASALMEDVDFNYGSDAEAIKLTGTAELRFGAQPRFNGVLSARQIDLDRLAGENAAPPAATIRRLVALAGSAFRPPFPITLGVGVDLVTLGGTDLQGVRGDISTAAGGWRLDRFEFRAPGLTEVRLSGRLGFAPSGAVFTGPADIASNDPNALAAWLEGRKDTARSTPRPLRLRGDITLSNEKIAIEQLNASFNRGAVSGRFVYAFGGEDGGKDGGRVEASLSAPELDIDAAAAFGKALLAGSSLKRPRDVALSLDIGRGSYAGIEAGKTTARLQYGADGLRIERLAIEDFGGATVRASGQIALAPAPHGSLALDFDARDLTGVNAIVARYLPRLAERLDVLAPVLAPAKLHATLKVDRGKDGNTAAVGLNGTAGIVRIALSGEGVADLAALEAGQVRLEGEVNAADSGALARLVGADRVLAVGKEPGVLRVKLSGNPFGDIAVATSISTGTLDVNATGTVQAAPGDWPSGMVQVNVKRADLAPLRPDGGKLPVTFSARVTSDGETATFDDISAVVAGSKVRGKMTASLTAPSRIEGRLDADTLDVTALLAAAAGLPKGAQDWSWSSAPFGGGMQHAVTGQVAINAMRANLAAGLTARQFRGVLDFGDDNVTLGDVSAVVAGGKLTGTIAFKSSFDGVTARLRGALADGDVTALLPRAARPPVGGRLNVTLDLEGAGRSPASLIGSLHGAGTIALTDGHFAGLDPRAFAAVTRAVDQGLAVEAAKIENVASRTLASGRLDVERAEGKLAVGAGQIRLTDAKASGEGAELAMSGVFDLTNGTINARLALTGSETAAGARPDIFVALNGPVTAPGKTLDVSGLTGWLTLRAIELQSKKLEAIQAAPKPEAKVEVKPEVKPELKPEPKPEPKLEAKPAQPAPPAATAPAKPKEAAAAKKPPAPPPHRPPPQAPSLPPPINILPLVNPPAATR